jgi:putative RecB family exonuclease
MSTPLDAVGAAEPKSGSLSFSRVSRFESCPLSYFLHYVEKHRPERGVPVRFGTAIHSPLERLLQEVIDEEYVGPLPESRALEFYREAWAAEELSGFELFEQGLRIIKDFVRDEGIVDHRDVLAVEREFSLQVGAFTVIGYIDRVNAIDADTIEVTDYKTNYQLFTREEVDSSLQLSIYEAAARQIWPWAKNVRLSFRMLRHGLVQQTSRTTEERQAALAYVEMLGRQIESATEFPARLNPNCSFCDHRRQCPAYAEALKGKRDFICDNLDDLEAVAREREEVARLVKALDGRKKELERVIKEHLKNTDELVLAGTRYRMFNATSLEYPLGPTLELVGGATGLTRDELIERIAAVDKDALDTLLKDFSKNQPKARVSLLKAELEAKAKKRHTPRLWAREA